MTLDYGGEDISELYLRMLERIDFPYRGANLGKTYDWTMMEDLKQKSASLAEVRDIAVEGPEATTVLTVIPLLGGCCPDGTTT